MREQSRFARSNVPVKLREHALRQVIGFDLVAGRQCAHFGNQTPVTADDPLKQSRWRQVVESPVLAIPLSGAKYQGQITR